MGLGNLRTDQLSMGGAVYQASRAATPNWQVTDSNRELTFSYLDDAGESHTKTIELKAGDDIEQVATYINGQTDILSASVDENGQLQVFADSEKVKGAVDFSGSFASEVGLKNGEIVTVNDLSIRSVGGAQLSVSVLDKAMQFVDSHRAALGANQNRLNHTINNLANMEENLSASQSRIRDTDYAKETTEMLKQQILQQVSTSILAQAKQTPNLALTLLQG